MQRIVGKHEVEERFNLILKPCPFCKSDYVGMYIGFNPHITCLSCKADGPYLDGQADIEYKQHQAIVKWNRRP